MFGFLLTHFDEIWRKWILTAYQAFLSRLETYVEKRKLQKIPNKDLKNKTGSVREASGKLPENFPEMSGDIPGMLQELSNLENFQDVSWKLSGKIIGNSKKNVQEMSKTNAENV